jgi:hypothetical protein
VAECVADSTVYAFPEEDVQALIDALEAGVPPPPDIDAYFNELVQVCQPPS